MALKYKLDKVAHAALPKDIQGEYAADKTDANVFLLQMDGEFPAPPELISAKQHEVTARKAAETSLKEARDALKLVTDERDGMLKGTVKKDDVDRLEASYKQKLADREKELTTQIGSLTGNLHNILVEKEAQALAAEISVSPSLILPHITPRLKAVEENGKFVTKVVDAEGKPSAATLSDLKKELLANEAFAPILVGSKGHGGGAHGGGGNGGAKPGQKIDFTRTPAQIAADLKASGRLQPEQS